MEEAEIDEAGEGRGGKRRVREVLFEARIEQAVATFERTPLTRSASLPPRFQLPSMPT